MKIRAVDFVLYKVSDYKKSVKFYKDILELKIAEEYGGFWAEFDAGNVTLALRAPRKGEKFKRNTGESAIALAVHNVKETIEELRLKGVKIIIETEETPVCFMAEISDLDGNHIILHQRKDKTAG